MTTTNSDEAGPRLFRYLQAEWDRLGTTRGKWCRLHSLADTTVYRWSQGYPPEINSLNAILAGLPGRDLLDLLTICGYLSEEAVKRRGIEPTPAPPAPTIEAALDGDKGLTDTERHVLRTVLTGLRGAAPQSEMTGQISKPTKTPAPAKKAITPAKKAAARRQQKKA